MLDHIRRMLDYSTGRSIKYELEVTRNESGNIYIKEYNPSGVDRSEFKKIIESQVRRNDSKLPNLTTKLKIW